MEVGKSLEVSFTQIRAATGRSFEYGYLICVDQRLAAVLLPAEQGWFMQAGFGPCDHEAMFFDTLPAASDWVRERFEEEALT